MDRALRGEYENCLRKEIKENYEKEKDTTFYFHFKTDRKGLTAQILEELEQAKEEK